MLPLGVLFTLNAVDELDRTAFAVLLPEIRDEFGLDLGGVTALVALVVPAVVLLGLPIGFLADRRRRTRLAAGGAVVWAGFSLATAAAPSVATLAVARTGAGLGKAVNEPTHNSLLADWYPTAARAGVYAVHRAANSVGQFAGPILAGLLAAAYGWRAPFLLFAIPSVLAAALAWRLQEPERGIQERRAGGLDDDDVARTPRTPDWEESWALLRGVGTLRALYRALPFLAGGILSLGSILSLAYDELYGVDEVGRGLIAAFGEPFQLAGLALGVPIATRLLRDRPRSLFRLIAAIGVADAVLVLAFAVAPSVGFAIAANCALAAVGALVVPGLYTIQSVVTPPGARSFGYAVAGLYALPGLVGLLLLVGQIGDAHGMRWALVVPAGSFVVGGVLLSGAGRSVDRDIDAVRFRAAAEAAARPNRDDASLLSCRGVEVFFGDTQVLFGVDFDVRPGEIVALLGTNGAGKSTLLRAVSGAIPVAGGAISYDGEDVTQRSGAATAALGISLVPGGKGVFPTLTVRENLELATWLAPDAETAEAAVAAACERFPILAEKADLAAGDLSGGQQQMLTLSMALVGQPRLLLIDELSLGLAPVVVEQLLEVVRAINAAGTTVVVVEQSVNIALGLAERAVFLEKGEVRFEGPTAELLDRPDVLRSVYLRGSNAGAAVRPVVRPASGGRLVAERRPVLEARGLVRSFGGNLAVDGVDLVVGPGEIVGFVGANGSGKTTCLDLISGHTPPEAGTVILAGYDVTGWPADLRAAAGLGRSFQDARLFPSLSVLEVLALARERHLTIRNPLAEAFGLPAQRDEEELSTRAAADLIDVLGLGAFADKRVGDLSTGSRRIVDLACVLTHRPRVLLLDEPSSGIAQREAEALGPLLLRIRDELGAALVLVEHDMALLTSVASRLVALELGQVVADGDADAVLSHPRVVASYLGGDPRAIARSGTLTPRPEVDERVPQPT